MKNMLMICASQKQNGTENRTHGSQKYRRGAEAMASRRRIGTRD
jgi:hypothetical protein